METEGKLALSIAKEAAVGFLKAFPARANLKRIRTFWEDARRTGALTAYLALIVLAGGAFSLDLRHAFRLHDLGAMVKPDTLFNADINIMHRAFSLGWATPRIKHPNLSNFVTPPVRVAAAVLSKFPGAPDAEELREKISLGVVPLLGIVRMLLLFSLCCRLGLHRWAALIVCVLDFSATSRFFFGSIPESFPLTGVALLWLLWLSVSALRLNSPFPKFAWLAAGVFATGVTVTNIVPFGLLLSAAHWGRGASLQDALRRSALGTAMVAGATVAIAGAFYVLIQGLAGSEVKENSYTYTAPEQVVSGEQGLTGFLEGEQHYMQENPVSRFLQFPQAFVDTFAAPKPRVLPYHAPVHIEGGPDIMLTVDSRYGRSGWLGLLALAVCMLMAAGSFFWLSEPAFRMLAWGCFACLFFHILLLAKYGDELFLYSQHWQVFWIVLIAGGFRLPGRPGVAFRALAAGAAVALMANSFAFFNLIERALAGTA